MYEPRYLFVLQWWNKERRELVAPFTRNGPQKQTLLLFVLQWWNRKRREPIAPFTRNGPQQQTRATEQRGIHLDT